MIWILFAIVTASVILAVARPLGRAAQPAASSASEMEAYKLQLAELDREQELGSIGPEEAEQTRTEISRRLLKVSRQGGTAFSGKPIAAFNTNIAFAAVAGVIAIGSAGLYAKYGTPTLSDQPLEARLSAPPSQQPLAIQISNTEHRLRADPDSAADWADIAPKYFRTMQFDKAALKETLLAYRIDGTPVLDPSRAADRRKLDEMLAWTDIEYAPAIRQRNRDKRIVTDDNMGTEWSPPKE